MAEAAAGVAMASNLSFGSGVVVISPVTGSPDPRQLPFGFGHRPYPASYPERPAEGPAIHVPVSCRLSATGFRFSGHPIPAGELGLPHGRLTGHQPGAGPQRGSHVPHVRDATGVGAPSTPGTAVSSRPDAVPGRRLPLPSDQSLHPADTSHRRGSALRGINEGSRDSPVRSAPHL
jgi:hypothetical protein